MRSSWFTDDQSLLLRRWWQGLQPIDPGDNKAWARRGPFLELDRGDRAALRRCTAPVEVLLQPSYARLRFELQEAGAQHFVVEPAACALVAGLVARVTHATGNEARPFAALLGHSRTPGRGPILSKLRFGQLQAAATEEELFLRMRRVIDVLDGQPINIAELGSDLLDWVADLRGDKAVAPADRVHVRWASSYFTEPLNEATNAAAKP